MSSLDSCPPVVTRVSTVRSNYGGDSYFDAATIDPAVATTAAKKRQNPQNSPSHHFRITSGHNGYWLLVSDCTIM